MNIKVLKEFIELCEVLGVVPNIIGLKKYNEIKKRGIQI